MPESYTLIRRKQKNVTMRIGKDGSVVVRAPKNTSRAFLDAFVEKNAGWITEQRANRLPPPDDTELERLRAMAQAVLPVRLAHWSRVMGLTPAGLRIKDTTSRYGSCNREHMIMLSVRLMRSPSAAIDYVVVHELAHIAHMNHGAEFYALIETYLPDWRERRALLRGI